MILAGFPAGHGRFTSTVKAIINWNLVENEVFRISANNLVDDERSSVAGLPARCRRL